MKAFAVGRTRVAASRNRCWHAFSVKFARALFRQKVNQFALPETRNGKSIGPGASISRRIGERESTKPSNAEMLNSTRGGSGLSVKPAVRPPILWKRLPTIASVRCRNEGHSAGSKIGPAGSLYLAGP